MNGRFSMIGCGTTLDFLGGLNANALALPFFARGDNDIERASSPASEFSSSPY